MTVKQPLQTYKSNSFYQVCWYFIVHVLGGELMLTRAQRNISEFLSL